MYENTKNIGFEVLTMVTMKNAAFWDVVLCRFSENQCFRVGKSASEEQH
jgi:hypothetical protein